MGNRLRPLRGRGRMWGIGYPGSATPGYVMGMLRIPKIYCTPYGVQNGLHPGGCGVQRKKITQREYNMRIASKKNAPNFNHRTT